MKKSSTEVRPPSSEFVLSRTSSRRNRFGHISTGFPSHASFYSKRSGNGLNERSPEQLVRTAFVLAGKEIDTGRGELFQAQLAVVVGVDCLERRAGHLRVQSDDVEEQLKLVFLYHAVRVGVDGAEEERQWTGEGLPQGGVLDLFLERGNERFLVECLATLTILQILLPNLQYQYIK